MNSNSFNKNCVNANILVNVLKPTTEIHPAITKRDNLNKNKP